MENDFDAAYAALCEVFSGVVGKLTVHQHTAQNYSVNTRVPSPFKQHKGAPMFFGSVRRGKAYVAFHLFPLYMNEPLTATISPELKKRMQGKTCFNFKTVPETALLKELIRLTRMGLKDFEKRGWA
jgi:hypothetical protein